MKTSTKGIETGILVIFLQENDTFHCKFFERMDLETKRHSLSQHLDKHSLIMFAAEDLAARKVIYCRILKTNYLNNIKKSRVVSEKRISQPVCEACLAVWSLNSNFIECLPFTLEKFPSLEAKLQETKSSMASSLKERSFAWFDLRSKGASEITHEITYFWVNGDHFDPKTTRFKRKHFRKRFGNRDHLEEYPSSSKIAWR